MSTFTRSLKKLIQNEDGVTAIEYALLAALIAVAILASVTNVGLNVLALYTSIADQVATAVGSAL